MHNNIELDHRVMEWDYAQDLKSIVWECSCGVRFSIVRRLEKYHQENIIPAPEVCGKLVLEDLHWHRFVLLYEALSDRELIYGLLTRIEKLETELEDVSRRANDPGQF